MNIFKKCRVRTALLPLRSSYTPQAGGDILLPTEMGRCTGAGTHICWSQVKKLQRIRSWTAEKRSLRDDLEKVLVGDLPVNVV